jgi:hypothetical protein
MPGLTRGWANNLMEWLTSTGFGWDKHVGNEYLIATSMATDKFCLLIRLIILFAYLEGELSICSRPKMLCVLFCFIACHRRTLKLTFYGNL